MRFCRYFGGQKLAQVIDIERKCPVVSLAHGLYCALAKKSVLFGG
jgi:hypothetical protein